MQPKFEQDVRGNDSVGLVVVAVCEMGCVTYNVIVEIDTQPKLIFKDAATPPAKLAIYEILAGELEGGGFGELILALVMPA